MPQLAEHYTVVAPDLLGHGRSAKPRGDYSLGAYAERHPRPARRARLRARHRRRPLARRRHRDAVRLPVPRVRRAPRAGLQRRPRQRGPPAAARGRAARLRVVLPLLARELVVEAGEAVARSRSAPRLEARPRRRRVRARLRLAARRRGARARSCTRCARSIDAGGQRVSALDRLYLAEQMPVADLWGDARPDHPGRATAAPPTRACRAAATSSSRARATGRCSTRPTGSDRRAHLVYGGDGALRVVDGRRPRPASPRSGYPQITIFPSPRERVAFRHQPAESPAGSGGAGEPSEAPEGTGLPGAKSDRGPRRTLQRKPVS